MAAIYSTRLIAAAGSPCPLTTYTCPAGYVAVVVDLSAYLAANSGSTIDAFALDTGHPFWIAYSDASVATAAQWRGRLVITEGEELLVEGGGTGYSSLVASGYLLAA